MKDEGRKLYLFYLRNFFVLFHPSFFILHPFFSSFFLHPSSFIFAVLLRSSSNYNKVSEGNMKISKILIIFCLLLTTLMVTGCRRSPNEVWEDTKSSGRHINRGVKTLGGKHGDSRAVANRGDFMPDEYVDYSAPIVTTRGGGDFIPLADTQNDVAMANFVSRQPSETPGEYGSSIPGINAFRDPVTIPGLSGIFRNISFEYNSFLVKGQDNLDTCRRVADYLRANPNTYIFVEGHCDERGPEAYNLALGSRRANAIRNELLQMGVNSDNVFTISYGKERPLIVGASEDGWAQNRRGEFKIYQR
jgi:peptidoglycan-associated lipoprotein